MFCVQRRCLLLGHPSNVFTVCAYHVIAAHADVHGETLQLLAFVMQRMVQRLHLHDFALSWHLHPCQLCMVPVHVPAALIGHVNQVAALKQKTCRETLPLHARLLMQACVALTSRLCR
jgi:hypothetical protein